MTTNKTAQPTGIRPDEHGRWWVDGVAAAEIAAHTDTPTYVYSHGALAARADAYTQNVPDGGLICYALKANSSPAVVKALAARGMGADVTSGGELYIAQQAGFHPHQIIFSGVGKRDEEIRQALRAGIFALHVESPQEMDVIAAIAAEMDVIAPVGVRLNPNIAADTHPYISTGMNEHKFGVPVKDGIALLHQAHQHAHLRPVGIAAHIGSQIREVAPFAAAAERLVQVGRELRTAGITIDYIDVGGGWGIDYETAVHPVSTAVDEIKTWLTAVGEPVRAAGFRLVAEPGRSITAAAGLLLTRVIYTKQQGDKRFVIVDAGMGDLLRPTLYQAHHPIAVVAGPPEGDPIVSELVGPICETGDFLAKGRPLPSVARGDLLAVLHTGAYGFAMSSNYNGRPRPAEVLVDGAEWHIIRPRQELADLWH